MVKILYGSDKTAFLTKNKKEYVSMSEKIEDSIN